MLERYKNLFEDKGLSAVGTPSTEAQNSGKIFSDYFFAIVDRFPNKVAVEYNSQTFTFSELAARARQLSCELVKQGVKSDDHVAIAIDRNLDLITCYLAVVFSGATYIPIDTTSAKERNSLIFDSATPTLLLTSQAVKHTIPDKFLPKCLYVDEFDFSNKTEGACDFILKTEAEHAYVIFTSGSTGIPKGVQVPHRCLLQFLLAMQHIIGCDENDVFAALTTVSFDISGLEIFLPLLCGAQVSILDELTAKDGFALAEKIEEQSITVLQATPATFKLLLYGDWLPEKKIKHILCGGEALPEGLAKTLYGFSDNLWNVYGPTETTIWSTVHKITNTTGAPLIGKPIPGTFCLITDKKGNTVKLGQAGELCIGGLGVTTGYLNDPEKTEKQFIRTTDNNINERIYKTGDQALINKDGNIEYLGRLDFQVKIRGFRIELPEIENIALRFKGCRECVVVAAIDKSSPDGDKYLHAFYSAEKDCSFDEAKFKAYLEDKLPAYMQPYLFTALELFPLNSNGKIDRNILVKMSEKASVSTHLNHKSSAKKHSTLAANISSMPNVDVNDESVELELKLKDIWFTLFNSAIESQSSFYSTGMSSLRAFQYIARIRREFNITVSLLEFSKLDNIRHLSALVTSRLIESELHDNKINAEYLDSSAEQFSGYLIKQPSPNAVIAKNQKGEYFWCTTEAKQSASSSFELCLDFESVVPLNTYQLEIWLLSQASDEASKAFNLYQVLESDVPYNEDWVEQCIQVLIARHVILRAQVDNSQRSLCINAFDSEFVRKKRTTITALSSNEELDQRLKAFVDTPLDLERDSLFSSHLFGCNNYHNNKYYLVFFFHHILLDGTSINLLVNEFSHLYQSLAKGEALSVVMPDQHTDALSIKYHYLRLCVENEIAKHNGEYQKALDYWRAQYSQLAPLTALPSSKNRPLDTDYRAHHYEIAFPRELYAAMNEFASTHKVTVFSLAYAAYLLLVSRLTGERDVVVGVPNAGQFRGGFENLIGHCVSTMPLRHQINESETVESFVRSVEFALRDGQDHALISFADILRVANFDRVAGHNPLVSTLFNHWHADTELDLGKHKVTAWDLFSDNIQFDAAFAFRPKNGEAFIRVDYKESLFDRVLIEHMVKSLFTILAGLCEVITAETEKRDITIASIKHLSNETLREIDSINVTILGDKQSDQNISIADFANVLLSKLPSSEKGSSKIPGRLLNIQKFIKKSDVLSLSYKENLNKLSDTKFNTSPLSSLLLLDSNCVPVLPGTTGELHIDSETFDASLIGDESLNWVEDPNKNHHKILGTGIFGAWTMDSGFEVREKIPSKDVLGNNFEWTNLSYHLKGSSAFTDMAVLWDKQQGIKIGFALRSGLDKPNQSNQTNDICCLPLDANLRSRLPVHLCPDMVIEFPGSGQSGKSKLSQAAIEKDYRQGDYDELIKHSAEPKTEVEGQLAKIWESLLNIEKPSKYVSFYSLGGYSLLVVKLLSQINGKYGLKIKLAKFNESDTIESLARYIEKHRAPDLMDAHETEIDTLHRGNHQKTNSSLALALPEKDRCLALVKPDSRYVEKHNIPIDRMVIGCDEQGTYHWYLEDAAEYYLLEVEHTSSASQTSEDIHYTIGPKVTDCQILPGLEAVVPLNAYQLEIWLLSQASDEASRAFNLYQVLESDIAYNEDRVKECLQILIAKHSILRARIDNNQRALCIYDPDSAYVAEQKMVVDTLVSEQGLDQHLKHYAETALNFEQDSLFSTKLLNSAEKHYLVFFFHHVLLDGSSINIFLREFSSLYQALSKGELQSLSGSEEKSVRYQADYVRFCIEEKVNRQTDAYQKALDYWAEQYESAPPVIELPLSKKRPLETHYHANHYEAALPSELYNDIYQFATSHKVTVFSLAYAAYLLLVNRLTSETDIVVGVPNAGQFREGYEKLVGHCVSTMPIRQKIDHNQRIEAFVRSVEYSLREGQDHALASFADILSVANFEREAGHVPLVSTLFNHWDAETELDFGEHKVSAWDLFSDNIQFDAVFILREKNKQASIQVDYKSSLFDEVYISQFVESFIQILTSLVRENKESTLNRDQALIKNITSLSDRQIHEVQDFGHCSSHESKQIDSQSLISAFNQSAKSWPSLPAIVHDKETISYLELDRLSNHICNGLIQSGLACGEIVAVALPRSVSLVASILGILKAGGVYLPIDTEAPIERIAFVLQDSVATQLIVQDLSIYEELSESVTLKAYNHFVELDFPVAKHRASNDTNAYLMYTSGSTGNPKGAMIPQSGIISLVKTDTPVTFDQHDNFLFASNVAFDALTWEIWGALLNGGTLHAISKDDLLDEEHLAHFIQKHKISVAFLPTGLFDKVYRGIAHVTADLKALYVGGDRLNFHSARHIVEHGKPKYFVNGYGPTEATTFSTTFDITSTQDIADVIPIGRPTACKKIFILDSLLQPVAMGVMGELCIGGDGLSGGYVNLPELTSDKFIVTTINGEENRIYRTGDFARWLPDGNIEYIGRKDHQVKFRGYRIELEEIEAKLVDISGIRDAVVMVNDQTNTLVAFCGNDNDVVQLPDIDSVKRLLKHNLPSYMIPAHIILLEQMPITRNGKVDKKKLIADFKSGIYGDTSESLNATEYNSDIEKTIAELWATLLQVSIHSVDESFYSYGGHSLLAIKMLSEIQFLFQVKVNFSDFVKANTVSSLAQLILIKKKDNETVDRRDSKTVEDILSRLPLKHKEKIFFANIPAIADAVIGKNKRNEYSWFVENNGEIKEYTYNSSEELISEEPVYSPTLYPELEAVIPLNSFQLEIWMYIVANQDASVKFNVYQALETEDKLNAELLARTFQYLFDRHDALRSYIDNDTQSLCVKKSVSPEFIQLELSLQDINDFFQTEISKTFNLENAPLFKTYLITKGNQKYVFLLAHHLIIDGSSIVNLLAEIPVIYNALLNDVEPQLPKATQYTKFSLQHHLWNNEGHKTTHLKYWSDIFTTQPPFIKLPTSAKKKESQKFAADNVELNLSDDLNRSLSQLPSVYQTTNFTVIYSAYLILLSRLSGEKDIVVGVPNSEHYSGRNERLVGHCVSTMPLRHLIDTDTRLTDFVREVDEVLRNGQDHASVSLSDILSVAKIDRSHDDMPLVSTLFNGLFEVSDTIQLGDASVHLMDVADTRANFNLHFSVLQKNNNFKLNIKYKKSLYSKEAVEYWAEIYINILSSFTDKSIRIKDINSVCTRDLDNINLWNNTEYQFVEDYSIISQYEHYVAKQPDSLAMTYQGKGFSYAELYHRAIQFAEVLESNNASDIVALYIERSPDMIAALLGVLKSGRAYLPIALDSPEERLLAILNQVDTNAIITSNLGSQKIPVQVDSAAVQIINSDNLNWPSKAQVEVKPFKNKTNLAYVIFTSGTTGIPKGVKVTKDNIHNYLQAAVQAFYHPDISGSIFSGTYSFDGALPGLILPLVTGGTVALFEEGYQYESVIEKIKQPKKLLIKATPSQMNALLYHINKKIEVAHTIVLGGEVLTRDLLRSIYRYLPNVIVFNQYGPTETTIACTYSKLDKNCLNPKELNTSEQNITSSNKRPYDAKITIGRPFSNVRTYILDEDFALAPRGTVGEIYVAGAGITEGYIGRQEETDLRYLNIQIAGRKERLYRTGDLGCYLVNGDIDFKGRWDNQIKLRGYRIEPEEIIQGLKSSFSDATVVKDDKTDNLIAFVIASGPQPDLQKVKTLLEKKLPPYMVPSHIEVMSEFPITVNGKIDSKVLLDQYHKKKQRKADGASNIDVVDDFEIKSDLESCLVTIWKDLLKVPSVGLDDDFFYLGGNSLLAIKLVSTLKKSTGIDFSIHSVFQTRTINGMIGSIGQHEKEQSVNLIDLRVDTESNVHTFYISGFEIYLELNDALKSKSSYSAVYAKEEMILKGKVHEDINTSKMSIENLASSYFEAIERQGLDKTTTRLRLMGLSIGGLVTFELCKLLEEKGYTIDTTVLLDSHVATSFEFSTLRRVYDVLTFPVKQLMKQSNDRVIERLINSYSPKKTRTKSDIVLVKAEANPYRFGMKAKHDRDWNNYIENDIKIVAINAEHVEMMYKPHVEFLAAELDKLFK